MTPTPKTDECPVCEKRISLDLRGNLRKHRYVDGACPGWGCFPMTGTVRTEDDDG